MRFFGIELFGSRSSGWPKLRKQHLSQFPKCAACGRSNKVEVHHIIPVHVDPDKELDPDNLITLCDNPCHIVFGHLLDYKSWNPSVESDCEIYYDKIKSKPRKQ